MTADELLKLVDKKADADIVVAVAGLTDDEREALAGPLSKRFAAALAEEKQMGAFWPASMSVRLAVLAVCSWKDCKRVRLKVLLDDGADIAPLESFIENAAEIVLVRKADWAEDWLNNQLTGTRADNPRIYPPLMRLVSAGLATRPSSKHYAKLLGQQRVLDFDGDPAILEHDIWLLFDYEINCWGLGPFREKMKERESWSLQWIRRPGASKPHRDGQRFSCWPRCLYFFLRQGRIDRGRLLDSVLAVLAKKLQPRSVEGLLVLHELIAPTAEEVTVRRESYLKLIASGSPAVAKDLRRLKSSQLSALLQDSPTTMWVGAQVTVEQYNDGPNGWLYDDSYTQALLAADIPQGGRAGSGSRPNAAELAAAQAGQLLCVLTDDDFDGCVVRLGTPTKGQLRASHRAKSAFGVLNLPTGKLRVDGPNWLRIDPDNQDITDKETESGLVEFEPGQYEVTVYRADLEDLEFDEPELLLALSRLGDCAPVTGEPTYFLGFES